MSFWLHRVLNFILQWGRFWSFESDREVVTASKIVIVHVA